MMPELGTEPHGLPTFFTVVTFKTYTLFLVYSHVGVPIPLVFIFVRTGVTFAPNIIMAVDMSVQIYPVLETMITAFVFAHETGVSLMGYPVLFQPTFKWEALATVLTDKMKIFVGVHMFVQGSLGCKLFVTHLTVNYSMICLVVIIKLLDRAKRLYANFAPYGTSLLVLVSMH